MDMTGLKAAQAPPVIHGGGLHMTQAPDKHFIFQRAGRSKNECKAGG